VVQGTAYTSEDLPKDSNMRGRAERWCGRVRFRSAEFWQVACTSSTVAYAFVNRIRRHKIIKLLCVRFLVQCDDEAVASHNANVRCTGS
jgi:hypothetical protein